MAERLDPTQFARTTHSFAWSLSKINARRLGSGKMQGIAAGEVVMDFLELIRNRRSIRAYSRRELEPEKVEAVLDATRLAPSAGDLQAYEVVLVRSGARKEALARAAYDQTFIAAAPAVLVFLADPERSRARYGVRGAELYSVQDATIAAAYAQLAASSVGLASCWVGSFDRDAVAEAVGARAPLWPIALLPLAHAAETPDPMPRRSIEEFVSEETVGAGWSGKP